MSGAFFWTLAVRLLTISCRNGSFAVVSRESQAEGERRQAANGNSPQGTVERDIASVAGFLPFPQLCGGHGGVKSPVRTVCGPGTRVCDSRPPGAKLIQPERARLFIQSKMVLADFLPFRDLS